MKTLISALCVAVCLLAISRPAAADSILVGSDVTSTNSAAGVLCPSGSDCSIRAQQFTLLVPVVIDDIKVALSTDGFFGAPNGGYTVGLGSAPIDNTGIGSGTLAFTPNEIDTYILDFSGLNISLGPGTYYLGVTGDNLIWDYAPALSTSAGTLGKQLSCDPTVQTCSNPAIWDVDTAGPYAMEISGTAVTPEPSGWLLLATGLTGAAAMIRRKLIGG